jgi:hypothetical protein
MGVFNYNNEANTLDVATFTGAFGREIATAGWVRARISEHNPTGNCATGQTGSASSTSSTSSTSNTSSTRSTRSTSSTSTSTSTGGPN